MGFKNGMFLQGFYMVGFLKVFLGKSNQKVLGTLTHIRGKAAGMPVPKSLQQLVISPRVKQIMRG